MTRAVTRIKNEEHKALVRLERHYKTMAEYYANQHGFILDQLREFATFNQSNDEASNGKD